MTPHRTFFEILGLVPCYPLQRAALVAASGLAAGEASPSIFGVVSDLTGVETTIAIIGAGALTTIPLARVFQLSIAPAGAG